MAFEDAFTEMALSRGFGDFVCRCCPQCGYPMLQIQTACLKCGMIATYEGTNAKSLISVEALKKVEDEELAARVGLAPRVTVATSTLALAQPVVEEDEEMEMLPGKSFDTSTSVYTLTNSTTAHHLNSLTRVTSS